MARIDSLLSILVQQAATELRIGTDREPKMFARGAPKRLNIPATPDDVVRHLLGDELSPERLDAMKERGRVDFTYDAGALGSFLVTMTTREGGLDAVFVRAGAAVPSAAPRPRGEEGPVPAVTAPEGRSDGGPVVGPPPPLPSAPSAPEERPPLGAALESLVAHAVALRATDLHLADGQSPVVRVDGSLRPLAMTGPVRLAELLAGLLSGRAREALAQRLSFDDAFTTEAGERVRVNVYHAATGLAAALRLVPRSAPTLASLHLPLPLDDLAELPHGLVIVCGPTGSGKSTTLSALANEALRRRSIALITLEDPVEQELPATAASIVRQRQVGKDVRDFATGLRDALREDPDVLLVGEMRDPETISLALTAAETGHLVLTTLHSRSACSAVERIVDAYPPARQQQIRGQLADALRAVVSQRLVPRLRGGGRVVALEVLRTTHAVAGLIRDGKTPQLVTAMQAGRREGMIPLERSLADLVQGGHIADVAARAVANDVGTLASYLAR